MFVFPVCVCVCVCACACVCVLCVCVCVCVNQFFSGSECSGLTPSACVSVITSMCVHYKTFTSNFNLHIV